MKTLKRLLASDTGRLAVPAFAVSLVARVVQVLMAILAARLLQPAGYGVFTFALGVGLLGGRLASLGWPILVFRMIPKYVKDRDWGLMKGVVRTSGQVVIAGSVVCSLALVALALALGSDSQLYLGLMVGAAMLPFMAFRALYRNLLSALRSPQFGIMVDELLPALLMTLILLALLGTDVTAGPVGMAYVGASAVAVVCGYVWVRQRMPGEVVSVQAEVRTRQWMSIALPAVAGTAAQLVMNKSDILMLAPLSTMEEVGVYGAALRITFMQMVLVRVLSTVITAQISEAFAAGRIVQAKRLLYGSLVFCTLASAPLAVAFVIWNEALMALIFGASFAPGGPALAALAIAQVAAAIGMPLSAIVLMTGRQGLFGQITLASLGLNLALNVYLIPEYGAMGAAIATVISTAVMTVLLAAVCVAIFRSGRYEELRKPVGGANVD